jgi:AraC-like DNA-binding protein
MAKLAFSSDQLPDDLDDAQRFALWCELYSTQYGTLAFDRAENRPFSACLEYAQFGAVTAGWFDGALVRAQRTKHELRRDAKDEFFLFFNRGKSPIFIHQHGRETLVEPRMAALLSYSEAADCRFGNDHTWVAFTTPQGRLRSLVRNVEDLVAAPLEPQNEAMCHLRSYADFLYGAGATGGAPALAEHIGNSLLDLMALALGASRSASELARARGLRAARLRAVLAEIETGFSNPGFSPGMVAKKLHLSLRYVQDLLHDTGVSFVERVAELRLQSARRMLTDHRCDTMTIGAIADACGFSELPYFNRCFRKRFGASPTSVRSSPD